MVYKSEQATRANPWALSDVYTGATWGVAGVIIAVASVALAANNALFRDNEEPRRSFYQHCVGSFYGRHCHHLRRMDLGLSVFGLLAGRPHDYGPNFDDPPALR